MADLEYLERGPAREELDGDEVGKFRGSVVVDDSRSRPRYFDGRFLAARDLGRDQSYFLSRMSDLGRASGGGVVHGLMVALEPSSPLTVGRSPGTLLIDAGHGFTPGGELVVLRESTRINLQDIPTLQRLDIEMGLSRRRRHPTHNRSGLFVLALRPIEYKANPIATYPTSIEGKRTVEDGDIIEGVAVSLIPYPIERRRRYRVPSRSQIAWETFVQRSTNLFPEEALPLAVLELRGGAVQWVDPFLARREVGSQHGDVLGLGYSVRTLAEAYSKQYERHLSDVLAARAEEGGFSAAEVFRALPPAGRMPASAVRSTDFTQVWLPPEVETSLSFVAEDEIPALLEESFLLPPLDLSRPGAELESTSVVFLLPVERSRIATLVSTLKPRFKQVLRAPLPGRVAFRRPIERLHRLRMPFRIAPTLAADPIEVAWQAELSKATELFYIRRRNVERRADILPVVVEMTADEPEEEERLRVSLDPEVAGILGTVETRSTLSASAGLVSALSGLDDLGRLNLARRISLAPTVTRATILRASEELARESGGEGRSRIFAAEPELEERPAIDILERAGVTLKLDEIGKHALMSDRAIAAFARQLLEEVESGPARVAEFVEETLRRLRLRSAPTNRFLGGRTSGRVDR